MNLILCSSKDVCRFCGLHNRCVCLFVLLVIHLFVCGFFFNYLSMCKYLCVCSIVFKFVASSARLLQRIKWGVVAKFVLWFA